MPVEITEEISIKTIAKYLGCHGKPLDDQTGALADRALLELSSLTPRHVLRRVPLSIEANRVFMGSISVSSSSLAKHLGGCGEAVLLAATLGVQADQMIHRALVARVSYAVVLQACAAAKLEAYLNAVCSALAKDLEPENLYLTPRFSPGYGDLSLDCQGEILALTEAGKRIGLGLTNINMLAPAKSVTAIMGLSAAKQTACYQSCLRCLQTACPFREE